MNIVLVCGGRFYDNHRQLDNTLLQYHAKHGIDMLVHGGANGADSMAGAWAMANQLPHMIFPAQWDKFGRSAGHKRNAQMLLNPWVTPNVCIAFKGSTGTRNMIQRARTAGLKTYDIEELLKGAS